MFMFRPRRGPWARAALGCLVLLCSTLLPAPGAAAEWPQRPVRLLVPGAPGGASDLFSRLIAEELAKEFGQPFVVENRPGASGTLVTVALANAAADGYTLAMSFASALVPVVTMRPEVKQTWADLTPIARFGAQGTIVVVAPKLPVQTLQDLVDYVKTRQGKLNYASYGIGSGGHIVMEALKNLSGMQINHVPYQGVPRILNDMKGGIVDIAVVDPVTPIPMLQDGSIRALATNGHQRLPALPGVPTMAEQGYAIYMESWYGLFGPKGLDPAVVERLNRAVADIVARPAMLERFTQLNLASTANLTPTEFRDFIADEVGVWGRVIQANRIRPE
ncbi:tripartite tricarboxylate transporter substrate binding protein [Verticiella sediminum]|uniref:Tripartite tricarboxylate transporter substrate binding protein n=1 Tax=Verticiella sediminum TaxID=1247510 RepID=A0A556AY57_9BURK|nr:tripartite tricarboxylate transporter substrate binding protein [Verticiella sediminum]TSH97860.1 tripartite tricarboxylate transporter substrate binding protein [Verticiella sediminum]